MSVCCQVSVGLMQGRKWHWRIFCESRASETTACGV